MSLYLAIHYFSGMAIWQKCLIVFIFVGLAALFWFLQLPKSKSRDEVQIIQKSNPCCKRFLTTSSNGRLGNRMSEYATLKINAAIYNYEPVMTRSMNSDLKNYFPYISIPNAMDDPTFKLCCINEKAANWTEIEDFDLFEASVENLDNSNIYIGGWADDLKKTRNHFELMRREFRFHADFKNAADEFIMEKRKEYLKKHKSANLNDVIFVGIHARRTDYKKYLHMHFKGVLVTEKYFELAMERMKKTLKTKHVAFIMSSDDLVWCYEHFSRTPDLYFVPRAAPKGFENGRKVVLDLAILAGCDHSIISYGTYGMWSAILAGGQVILADGFEQEKGILLSNLPQNWTAIKDPCIRDEDLRHICNPSLIPEVLGLLWIFILFLLVKKFSQK